MGPKQSQAEQRNSAWNGKDNQVKESSVQMAHNRFQNGHFLSEDGKQFIKIDVGVANENDIRSWNKNFRSLELTNSLLLPLSYEYKKTELCGNGGICSIKYEAYPLTLSEEIANRQTQNNHLFDESQLWYLAFILLDAAQIFHSKGLKIGDVRPQNIFINQDGMARVSSQYSWPYQSTNYEKTVYQKETTYLAPEEIKQINFGKLEEIAGWQSAQSFSIGLTLLDSSILSNSKELYLPKSRFDYNKLDQWLTTFRNLHHSQPLKLLIEGLCRADPENRPNATQLYNWLKPNEQRIVNLEPFQVQSVPNSLLQTTSQNVQLPSFREEPTNFIEKYHHSLPVGQYQPPTSSQGHPPRPFSYVVPNQAVFIKSQVINTPIISSPIQNHTIQETTNTFYNSKQPQQYRNYNGSRNDLELTSKENDAFKQLERNTKKDDFKDTLQKIEEQLALSRKMFPS